METTEATAGSGLETITLGRLLAHPFPPREHVLAPWFRDAESVLLWAPPGLGKSLLALSMALAVAGGGEVLGWKAPKPRRVMYLDGEMHAADLRDRLEMLRGAVAGLDAEATEENFLLLSRQLQRDPFAPFPDIASEEGADEVIARALEHGAELVIVDNLATCAIVTDENDAAAMRPVLNFLMRLKSAGIAVVLVHHSDKGGRAARGSSMLSTTFEASIGLHRVDGHAVGTGAAFELRWTKFRGAPSAATRDTQVELVGGRWRSSPAKGGEVGALVDAVRSGRCRNQTELAKMLGAAWDQPKVSRVRRDAIQMRAITPAEWNECLRTAREEDAGEDAQAGLEEF